MDIQIGKMYEVTHPMIVETVVFDLDFKEVARLEQGETFVVLESLDLGDGEQTEADKIFKMKVLTTSGKIGFCSFWSNEIKIVQN